MINELLQECAAAVARNLGTGELADTPTLEPVRQLLDASGELLKTELPRAAEASPEELQLPTFSHAEITAAKPGYDRLMRGGDARNEPFEPDTLPSLPKASVEKADTQALPSTTPRALLNQAIIAPPVLPTEKRAIIQSEPSGARGDERSQHQGGDESEDENENASQDSAPELTEADLLQRVRRQNLTGI